MYEDKIIGKLLEHDERFFRIEEKVNDLVLFRNEQSTTNDQMMAILKRLYEERHFMASWVERIENVVKTMGKKVQEHNELLIQTM